jgi:hypothetical protein
MMRVLLDYYERLKYPDFPKELPDSLFNEEWAQKIHSQSLKRLNERGGLHPKEMIGNIKKLPFDEIEKVGTETAMTELILFSIQKGNNNG